MTWHRVLIEVPAPEAELVCDVLWATGPAAIEEQDAEPAPDGTARTRLLAGYPDRAGAEDALTTVAHIGAAGRIVPVDDDGLDGWRAFAQPERAGRFTIVPPWCEAPQDGTEVLWVDPGRTFGSGSHPTTRLVLAALGEVVRPGDRVLDVGTGSGVLAVGAARLGAAQVIAIDIDPASPAVAAACAAANGVADRVAASATPLAELGAAPFDVVAANLLAGTIAELADELTARTRPGGHLVVSGLLADRWPATVAQLAGFEVADGGVRTDDGWAAVVLVRTGGR